MSVGQTQTSGLGSRVIAGFLGGALAIAAMVGTGLVGADGESESIYACVNNASGSIFVVDADADCKPNSTKVEWNKQGPRGEQGLQGPRGEKGPQGESGTLASLDDLHGTACNLGASTEGILSVVYASDGGQATLTCVPDPTAIWLTRNDCGEDVSQFVSGETVFINGRGFPPGVHDWSISNAVVVAAGTITVGVDGTFCFPAYTVRAADTGVFNVLVGDETDSYLVTATP